MRWIYRRKKGFSTETGSARSSYHEKGGKNLCGENLCIPLKFSKMNLILALFNLCSNGSATIRRKSGWKIYGGVGNSGVERIVSFQRKIWLNRASNCASLSRRGDGTGRGYGFRNVVMITFRGM